ncbi:MAG: M20 family peptidase [Christensenellales bacterium]|jgi:carboxypeptidase PM20D1
MRYIWILPGLLSLWLLVVIVRALLFRPRPKKPVMGSVFPVEEEAAVQRLAEMLRFRTVSYADREKEDPAQFTAFREYLRQAYPSLTAACGCPQPAGRGILYRWKGKSDASPTVLMAHYDVVPVVEEDWQLPPFSGVIQDDALWGRGALDTKGTLHGIMEAAEMLLKQGFVPENDIYLAFGGDEEVFGTDAQDIIRLLESRDVKPAFVLDEGGAIVEKVFPGVHVPAAVIGTAEKGSISLELTAGGKGGHASAPPPKQAVGQLGRALYRLQTHPLPFRLSAPVKELFDTLGRESTFLYRLIFGNLWCFQPLLNLICSLSGGELNALVRTTCALTMLKGSDAVNVLPAAARARINLRLICGDSPEAAVRQVERIIADPSVSVRMLSGHKASAISLTGDALWQRLADSVSAVYPDTLVSPYLMVAGSDSRHYSEICSHVYRFSGMPLTKEERGLIHNANERIRVSQIPRTIRFYAELITRC